MTNLHQRISIGKMLVYVEDKDFVLAYDAGYEAYYRYHRQYNVIDATTLLFQLSNRGNNGCSDMWNTGYVMGWLAAFYEQEQGQLALCAYEPCVLSRPKE